MSFEGVHTPLVTPFQADGEIDHELLGRHAADLAGRVSGLGIGGTTGEYYALSFDERVRTFNTVAEAAGGRTFLTAGINATTTNEVIRLGQEAKRAGLSALLVAAPYYAQPTQDELLAHLLKVDDALDMPIMLYNFPARTGTAIGDGVLAAVLERPNFVAMKESTGDIGHLHHLATHFRDKLVLSCGMDDQALEFFVWGAKSWVAGASNFLPEAHTALYDACVKHGDFETGRKLMAQLLPVLELLERSGKFIQYVRCGCELAGMPVGAARAPLGTLSDDERRAFAELVKPLFRHAQ
ncbi:dihydrodipicolinate synthase family protein [Burkholderia ubonensis]|uniref:Dihydrodipicolinate synthase family protein n=2 Tax=Burkholderia cepacia complex TaxID=87882 RepID=A0A1B4PZR1_BURCE|nr:MULTISPECIES: dihydrodipicolinate synthase family protein [Burkholderia cepacia complex]AOK19407.1 dihydrodipicolinate synthase family protein [Burkholderia cepacia]AOK26166.1 dihydrodipicolinate synthase family protein [Burkholderia ubonensis]KVN62147.1 dihydrodipicolinate synthase family protein [Burkholderia ubonensis]KWI07503.1 dihydrodipicolinate synthase family protein [Burkholderia ubonensis]KWI23960.1 dihydrodipicolinate synthase family protein [Burkholderia ubonensis]